MEEKRLKSEKTGKTMKLTEDIKQRTLGLILEGKNYKEIAEELQVPYSNLLYWKHNGFRKESIEAELEYQLAQAEQFTNDLMKMATGKKDVSLLAIKQRESEFRRRYQVNAKTKYNDTPQVAIQMNFPTPIVDLGKIESE